MASLADLTDKLNEILQEVRDLPTKIKVAASQVAVVTGLSDITERLGLIRAGEFRAGNQKEPGSGFSGVRIAYPSMTYGSGEWNIVGVENDTLQFGLRASDGVAIAGGGTVTLNDEGIELETADATSAEEAKSESYKFVDGGTIISFYNAHRNPVSGNVGSGIYTLLSDGNDANIKMTTVTDNGGDANVDIMAAAGFSGASGEEGVVDITAISSVAEINLQILSNGASGGIFLRGTSGGSGSIDLFITEGSKSNLLHMDTTTTKWNQSLYDVDFQIGGDTDANLFYLDASTDKIGIGTSTPTSKLDINSDMLRLRTSKTPTGTADSSGNTGDIAWDDNYVYVKTSAGWKRSALSTF